MLSPVVPVSAVCDELQVSRKTFRRWEMDGVIPQGAVIEHKGIKYLVAAALDDVLERIARHRAGNRS